MRLRDHALVCSAMIIDTITMWPLAVVGLVAFVVSACPPAGPIANPTIDASDAKAPPPPPPMLSDATPVIDTSPCAPACAAMAASGCKVLSDCARVMCMLNSDPHFVHYDIGCLANAKTPTDVKACGAACLAP
jgi:hypothetical protein